jgi:ribosomal protein L11 methyltransferase
MPKLRQNYLSFLLEGNRQDVEAALHRLFEAGCLGAEEIEDAETDEASGPCSEMGPQISRQRVYFPAGTDPSTIIGLLNLEFPSLLWGPSEWLPDQDWLSQWKKGLRGSALGRRFYVLPSWEAVPDTERIVIRIDPERAFGTGTHDTTRLCLELIEDRARPGMTAIDAGSGTGILAIAAAALGCRPVLAIEQDSEAASCARANVSRNGCADAVCVQVASLAQMEPPPADLVVANLNETILREELVRLSRWVRQPGYLILSGLLVEQVDPMTESLPARFNHIQTRTSGEWGALLAFQDTHA